MSQMYVFTGYGVTSAFRIIEHNILIREIDLATRMKTAFGKLLHCVVLISFLTWKERVCLLEVVLSTFE